MSSLYLVSQFILKFYLLDYAIKLSHNSKIKLLYYITKILDLKSIRIVK